MWRNAWRSTPPHKLAFGAAALGLLLAFTLFRPAATGGPIERDFEAYYAAGATLDAGGDPYSRAIWTAEARTPGVQSKRTELLPFVGPPATLPFWALLAHAPYPFALALWTLILLCAYLVVLVCALWLTGVPRDPLTCAGAAGVALAAAPMLSDLALGQAALISAAAVAAALVAYRARWLPGAFVATLLAAAQPNLALALVGRMRSTWDTGVAVLAGLAFAGLALAAGGGLAGAFGYIRRLRAHGDAERFVTIQHTPAAIAFALHATPPIAAAVGIAVAVVAIAATVGVILGERLDATTATLVCCATLPLAAPFFHEHDFVLEVLPVLVLGLRARGRARSLAAAAGVLILVDWFGLAQRHAAQGQILALGFTVAAGFIGLGGMRPRGASQLSGILLLALLAALAAPLGHAHPAPTWPDALPDFYQANPAADASGVWADEQRAAGLNAVDPVWGALRSLPLIGCALLAAALVADARDRRRRGRPPETLLAGLNPPGHRKTLATPNRKLWATWGQTAIDRTRPTDCRLA